MNEQYEDLEQNGFVIDSPGKADWAVRQIKEERARRDIYTQAAREDIDRLTRLIDEASEACGRKTSYLLARLDQYLDTVPAEDAKTQVSLKLPSGKLVRKKPVVAYERDSDALLAWCKEKNPEFVRTKEEPDWAAVKLYVQATGDIPDGVTPVETPARFDVR